MAKKQFRVELTTKGAYDVEVAPIDVDEYDIDKLSLADARDLLDDSDYIVNCGLGDEWEGQFNLKVFDENEELVYESNKFSDFNFVTYAQNFIDDIGEEEYAKNTNWQNAVAIWEQRWKGERSAIEAGTYIAAFHQMKWMTYGFVVEDEEFNPEKLLFLLNKSVEGLLFDYMSDPDHIFYNDSFVDVEDCNDIIDEYGTIYYIVKKWKDADWEHIREIEK